MTYQRGLGYERSLGKEQENLVTSGGKADTSPMDDALKSVADARRIVDEIVRRMSIPFRWTPIANDWQDCSPLMAQE